MNVKLSSPLSNDERRAWKHFCETLNLKQTERDLLQEKEVKSVESFYIFVDELQTANGTENLFAFDENNKLSLVSRGYLRLAWNWLKDHDALIFDATAFCSQFGVSYRKEVHDAKKRKRLQQQQEQDDRRYKKTQAALETQSSGMSADSNHVLEVVGFNAADWVGSDVTWTHSKTRDLFNIPTGDVKQGLLDRVEKLEHALETGSLVSVIEQGEQDEEMEEIGEKDVMRITKQCVLLKLAYRNAVNFLKRDAGKDSHTWEQCCQQALDTMAEIGEINKEISNYTLREWNKVFRQTETFPHPTGPKRKYKPRVFQQYPQAQQIACQYLDRHLQQLSTDFAAHYFRTQFIDDLLHSEDKEQHEQSQGRNQQPNKNVGEDKLPCFEAMDEETKEIVRDAVKEEIGVISITLTTTQRWLAYLGYRSTTTSATTRT